MRGKGYLVAALMVACLCLAYAPQVETAAAQVNSGGSAFLYPQTCYTEGYWYEFYVQLPSASPEYVYTSSSGFSLSYSSPTNIAAVSTTNPTATINDGIYGVYCDSSGNVYMAFQESATTFYYYQGTASAGTITWVTELTLTCTDGGHWCAPHGIFAYSTSAVYISLNSSPTGSTTYIETWQCTSTCSSSGSWSDVYSSSSGNVISFGIIGLGTTSSSQQYIFLGAVGGVVSVLSSYETYGTSRIATTNSYEVDGNGSPPQLSCVTGGSTTNVYCAAPNAAQGKVYYLAFAGNGVGGGSWTETALDTINYVQSAGVSTDGTHVIVSYGTEASSSTCPCSVYYQSASSLSSPSWSGRETVATGESGTLFLSVAPTLVDTFSGITWMGTYLGNAGASGIYTRFAFDQYPYVNVTVKTSPASLIDGFAVNGSWYSSSTTFTYLVGTVLNITASHSAVGSGDGLYTFSSWSDAGARSHDITLNSTGGTFTATFNADSCGGPLPIQQLESGCWFPAVVNWYSQVPGIALFMGIILGDIDFALFIKTRSALIAVLFFTIGVGGLGVILPSVFSEAAYVVLAAAIAGFIYSVYSLRK